jgi:hypothetical protein
MRDALDIIKAFDTNDPVDALQLGKVDAHAIDQIKDYLFPGMTKDSSKRIRHIVEEARDAITAENENVVWVPRSIISKTGLFDSPLVPGLADHKAAKAVLYGADTLQNIMKMMVLSANPAYYPMNMAGQNIMLLSQLGFTAPFSLARGLTQAHRLTKTPEGEELLALIDQFAGVGFAKAQFGAEVGGLKRFTNAFQHIGTVLIDRYPRRVSFLHEARRMGVKTDAQLEALLTDPKNFDTLMTVSERTKRAMVDYENLSQVEKGISTHLIFVYPWLHGSTKYTAQFPFDHPIQASLFAGLVYWQQNRLRDALPERPGYMKWYMPIHTGGGEENPYGFRMDQLATPFQTLDIAAMMIDWGSGKTPPWGSNEEPFASMLGPLAEEIEKTISGWDSFTQQEVSRNLPDLFVRLLTPQERWSSWSRLKKVLDHETHKGIYDTTQTQNWLRLLLGSLAPINVDRDKAEERGLARGNPGPEQNAAAFLKRAEQANGVPFTDAGREKILKWTRHGQAYRKITREYRDEHDLHGDSTIQDKVAMLYLTVGEVNPDVADVAKQRAHEALASSDETAQATYEALREKLGLRQLGVLEGRIRKAGTDARKEEIGG